MTKLYDPLSLIIIGIMFVGDIILVGASIAVIIMTDIFYKFIGISIVIIMIGAMMLEYMWQKYNEISVDGHADFVDAIGGFVGDVAKSITTKISGKQYS